MECFLGDPRLEEEFRSLKKRDLTETYSFKMACGSFGPQKCKNSVIRNQIMDQFNTAPKIRAQPRHFSILPETPASSRNCKSYPGNKPVEHPEWISDRKAFREALDRMGDLRRWLHNKPIFTDLEVLVAERDGRTKEISLPETSLYISPDADNVRLKLTMQKFRMFLIIYVGFKNLKNFHFNKKNYLTIL